MAHLALHSSAPVPFFRMSLLPLLGTSALFSQIESCAKGLMALHLVH